MLPWFKQPPSSPPPVESRPLHPFYPVEIDIANYIANDKQVLELVLTFAGGSAVILGATWLAVSRISPHLKATDKVTILWFFLSRIVTVVSMRII